MTEAQFQTKFIRRVKARFPGCVAIKNDAGYQQGIPDWTILYRKHWATLEVKASRCATLQPNQEYFVEQLDGMSFAAVVYPENEEEILRALEHAFAA